MTAAPAQARPSISLVVLALNEETNIQKTVKTILEAIENCHVSDYEIILVNDGSTDGTARIMEQLARETAKTKVVHNEKNLGLGGAYKRGAAVADCDYILIVAGDNAMPASDMALIFEQLGKADIILPYLANRKLRSLGRRIGSAGYTTLINLLFGLRVRYYNGFVPRRKMLNQITQTTESYAFQAEVVVKLIKGGCSYFEIALNDTPRGDGGSVALQPKRLLRLLRDVFNLIREISRPGAVHSLTALESPTAPEREA